jgi:hypothetical protein
MAEIGLLRAPLVATVIAMVRTTPPPAVDITQVLPGIAAFARTTVRLHPRTGNPSAVDSHFGGPLLWPADEPWPECPVAGPGTMAAIAQFFARDVPELPFPPDTDLLQVLWCGVPHEHEEYGPNVLLKWRRAAEVGEPLASAPTSRADLDRSLVPRPCVLHPERVTEYPWDEVLPEAMVRDLDEWEASTDPEHRNGFDLDYQTSLSIAPGSKVGGWAEWSVTGMRPMRCPVCGGPSNLLVAFDSDEGHWAGGFMLRWAPMEDRTPDDHGDVGSAAGWDLGRHAALRLFLCAEAKSAHRCQVHIA